MMDNTGVKIPEIFDRAKLADILGVTESKARTIMRSPGFPVRHVSPRKQRIVKREFLAWLSSQSGFEVSIQDAYNRA